MPKKDAGAAGTGLVAWINGGLDAQGLKEALLKTAVSTGMIFFIILGAAVFNSFLAFSQLPQAAAAFVGALEMSPWLVLTLILVTYLIFGCIMDSLSMILLTIPIFFPMVMTLDFGLTPEETALWFGILVLIVVEVGLITPPVGLNLYVVQGARKSGSMSDVMLGAVPYVLVMLAMAIALIAFPQIALWMPQALN